MIQPLVDHFIDALVAIGKKKPKWAVTDKIADDWHWFIFDAVINREFYSGGTHLKPDDVLWFEIIEQAVYELAKDNQKSILPDRRLTEAIVKVREGYEEQVRGQGEEAHQQEKSQEGSGQADQKNPKLSLVSEQLAVLKEREAQEKRYDESLPRFSSSTASSMSGD